MVPDVGDVLANRADAEVARCRGRSAIDPVAAFAFIGTMQDAVGACRGERIQLGIALRDGDLLIGDIGLWLSATIGCSCARRFQRQALTSEAVAVVIAALSQHTGCGTIGAFVDARALPSQRLLHALSFRHVATDTAVHDGTAVVEFVFERGLGDESSGAMSAGQR